MLLTSGRTRTGILHQREVVAPVVYAGGSGSVVQVPTGTNDTSTSVRCGSSSSSGEPPAHQSGRDAAPSGRRIRDPRRAGALSSSRRPRRPDAAAEQQQREQRQRRERCGLHHRELVLAVEPGGDDLGRHHPEAAAEDVRRAERAERGHEGEQRRAGERRLEVRQHHLAKRAPAAGAQARRRLELRPVQRGERRADQQVEVDVHRVGVDQQDRAGALQPPRRLLQPQQPHQQQRDEAGLAVEEQERDHADQRRQHRGQRHQSAQHPAARADRTAPSRKASGTPSSAASTTLATEIQRLPQSARISVGRPSELAHVLQRPSVRRRARLPPAPAPAGRAPARAAARSSSATARTPAPRRVTRPPAGNRWSPPAARRLGRMPDLLARPHRRGRGRPPRASRPPAVTHGEERGGPGEPARRHRAHDRLADPRPGGAPRAAPAAPPARAA